MSVLSLFSRGKTELSDKTIQQKAVSATGQVYRAFIDGLDRMQREYVDCAVLELTECEPSKNASGRWLTAGKDTTYYAFEMLPEAEQRLIKGHKHYARTALVAGNVGGFVTYAGHGIELCRRTYMKRLFLSALNPDSELRWFRESGVYTEDNLREYARLLEETGVTREEAERAIDHGIQEYHDITRHLIEKSGVHQAIEKLEQRQLTPFEQLMHDMRQQIAAAKR